MAETRELSKIATYDQCINKSDIQNKFNDVAKQMREKKVMFVLEKKEPTMVIMEPSEYLDLLSLKEHVEMLQDILEVRKAKSGQYHSEDEIDKMFKDAGFEGLKK